VEVQRNRLASVDKIREAMVLAKSKNLQTALESIKTHIKDVRSTNSSKEDKRVQALLKDLETQVTEAFSRQEYYNKWGIHYLPSLVNAHLLQVCNNFKDPGVQVYGGKLFGELRDRADDIFIKLPPPKPSYTPSAAPVPMYTYHNSGNSCFYGECRVHTANNGWKSVRLVQKGDMVLTSSGKLVEVVCVVKNLCNSVADLVELEGGLILTPYHPINVEGSWKFPIELAKPSSRPCDAVYSFVLKEEHTIVINGVPCVTLGHHLQEDIVKHPYFGTDKIVEDLKAMNGWESGLIILPPNCLVRDSRTSLVCGLTQSATVSSF